MKRFHVHVNVQDLDQSIRFYSQLFDAQPVVRKDDYAKWMLDDPRITITEAAHRMHHSSGQSLCRHIRLLTGKAPSEWRTQVSTDEVADSFFAVLVTPHLATLSGFDPQSGTPSLVEAA